MSGLRNASVGIATVTQESFESQYDVTQTLFGMTAPFTMEMDLVCFKQPKAFNEEIPGSLLISEKPAAALRPPVLKALRAVS